MSRSKDRNAENILKQELAIPPKTQQKIEAAYDIVRARANERQKTGDRSGKMAGGTEDCRGRRCVLKPSVAAVLAAAMILLCGLGVAAAVGHFTKQVEEADGAVRYAFENWADGDLFGEEIPVSSFRSDNWPETRTIKE